MSAAMSALPPPADSKKRRPAFRPANQKKKAAKIASPSKVVLERKEPASVDVDPLAEYENVPTEITANENEAPGVLFEEPAAAPPVEPKRRGPKRTVTPAADPSAPNALSSFCSKYRSKGPPKPKDIPDPLPPPTAVEPEPAAPIHAGPVVQIINGEIVLQASSMVVSSARKTVAELEEEFDQVVEEEGHTAVVGASYNSFVSRRKPQHWTVQETKLFYNALRQVGTDFACMESYFENRTRKQLKRKYQIESTKNPKLIELALDPKAKVAIDLSVFNVDRDSIVITKETPIIHQPTTGQPPPPPPPPKLEAPEEDYDMDEVDETETDMLPPVPAPTTPAMTMDSIFGDDPLFENFKELVEDTFIETEDVIPLLGPTQQTRVNKRPKFKARAKKK